MTIWDGGGSDTYDLSNYTNAVTIDLRPGEWTTTSTVQLANLGNGHFARGNIANALLYNGDTRSLIENAIGGSSGDVIYGNTASNSLNGLGGSDTIVLAGVQSNYTFAGTATNFTAAGFGATDTILNAEFVRFLGSGATVGVSSLLPADDYRDTITDPTAPLGTVPVGGSRTGRIEASGDADVFAVSLTAGQNYTFNLRGTATGGGTIGDPVLTLLSGAGATLQTNDDYNTLDSRVVYTAPTTGTYYLSARGFGSHAGTYTLGALANFDDHRDTLTDPTAPLGSLAVGGSRMGAIEATGDADVFAVSLTAGRNYRFEARGSATSGGTLADPELFLRNSAFTQVAHNDDNGTNFDSRITYTAPTSGTYYLDVQEFGDNAAGTYGLSAVLI
jgi:hypothetical protein